MSEVRLTVPTSGVHRRRLAVLLLSLTGVVVVAAAVATRGSEVRAAVSSAADRVVPGDGRHTPGASDGYVAPGASLSPLSHLPAVARLDPDLRAAVRQAASDARAAGLTLRINSGWRSARYQRELSRRAVAEYGSAEVARQFVKPASRSRHVAGDAVDVGPADAAAWLAQNGSAYGLCRIYANEAWHFELATSPGGPCPTLIANAAAG